LCSSLKHASAQVSERSVRLDNNLVQFELQLNFLQRIQHVMEEAHREVYTQTLQVLQNKLETVVSLMRGLLKPLPVNEDAMLSPTYEVKRWKYASKKGGLDEAIGELEEWQRLANQSWFLLLRIADTQVDQALATSGGTSEPSTGRAIPATTVIRAGLRGNNGYSQGTSASGHVNLPASHLKDMTVQPVRFCDGIAVATKSHSDGSASRYILNYIQCEPGKKPETLKRNVRDLVRKLQVDEPYTFGLLKCKGFVTESIAAGLVNHISLTLIFKEPPAAHNPRSLRDLLLNTPSVTSTTRRLNIARNLAKSVGYVHTFGFVHKNIRPESVLIFDSDIRQVHSAFLVGFENFRRDEGWTQRQGDDVPDKNLYRHSTRQGFAPSDDYEMRHDVYSLGVCLLEIGLWGSFVEYDPTTAAHSISRLLVAPFMKGKEVTLVMPRDEAKHRFVALAQSTLRGSMGDKYAEIVETCLTCLEPGNIDFGDDKAFEDEDGIIVGARYIEKVLLRLSRLIM
jgi:hypothetical protein